MGDSQYKVLFYQNLSSKTSIFGLGIGDWNLGIGFWGLGFGDLIGEWGLGMGLGNFIFHLTSFF